MALSPQKQKQILNALTAKGITNICPACKQAKMALVGDGYLSHSINDDPSVGMVIGGPTIFAVAMGCGNCGYLTQHALSPLGIKP